ncbi:RNA polymerase sigma factor [Fodinibius salsisoli]|uniref:Sigma-70 family RNA polymerase sigma factor n=1 Tax=Fodinibius salsisoli TaxID=2820877 RepID=A0ABT3PKZ4_9BACT|nr:sigma-70 family RNA polymerase sigma factor [Fodinibius salsisoli]MCW9706623.1 sigma-70 family RNA polymerase sigma factor [Fodinibius salsisoli]
MLFAQFKTATNTKKDDQELWSALRKGNRKALSKLFQLHHKHLYNYGLKIVSSEQVVNGVIQELFLNLWDKHQHLSTAYSVKAYLLSSFRRLIFKQIQKEKNRAKRNRKYIEREEELTFSVENTLIREEVAQEKRRQLHEAFQTLTARQKEAIFLKFYHGLTNRELVEVMDINYQCVRNLLYKALERLRSHIETISYQD